jgi:serine/threonine-protein kinase
MKNIGRYEVLEELGRGAMGIVYKASDPTIGRLVAIKALAFESSGSSGGADPREIFMREARAAGRLAHPGIVAVHDALEDPAERSSYIVMEYVPGETLESLLFKSPDVDLEKTLEIVRQIAEALDYAHRQQIIHRDLKPANILLTEDGRVKITDFGIAKILAREGTLRTTGVMGTPSYMSPEQVRGLPLDGRSDLFSLGIIFYLMLTGQKPFQGDTVAVMFKIINEDPPPPSHLKPQLNAALDYMVLRMLAKDRGKRYGSAREFLDDIEDFREGRPLRSRAAAAPAATNDAEATLVAHKPPIVPPPPAPKTQAAAPQRRLEAVPIPASRKFPWPAPAVVAAILVLVLAGALIRKSRQQTTPPPPAETAQTEPAPAVEEIPGSSTAEDHLQPSDAGAGEATEPAAIEPQPAAAPVEPPAPARPERTASARREGPRQATAANLIRTLPGDRPWRWTPTPRDARFIWVHNLSEATLTLEAGGQTLYTGSTRSDSAGQARIARPIIVPANVRAIEVRVVSRAGSLDLKDEVPAAIPPGAQATLVILVSGRRLRSGWLPQRSREP